MTEKLGSHVTLGLGSRHAASKGHWAAVGRRLDRAARAWALTAALATLICGLAPLFATGAAQAETSAAASPWVAQHKYAKARMIVGRVAKTPSGRAGRAAGTLYAGVELIVADGWKTYWRNSGDAAGVPPYFDFKGSLNVKSSEVLYPAPHRFSTPDGDSIGYKRKVIFPIRLMAADRGKPIVLKLRLDYGVCSDICVPARAKFSVKIRPGDATPLLG